VRFWLAAIPLSTGAGLIVHVASDISLLMGVALSLILAISLVTVVLLRLPAPRRREIGTRVLVGAAAGLAATVAYDATRLIVVTAIPMTFWPFDAIQMFGRLLAGPTATPVAITAVGVGYHLTNGICFGIGYALIVKQPRLRTAIAWAAFLEALMVSIYPGWLHLQAMDEFLSVSIAGHAAYGLTLGLISRHSLASARRESGDLPDMAAPA